MMIVESDLNEENCAIYVDEVALVNVFRRTKRGLSTGYGEVRFSVEVVDHCGRSITTVFEERAIVDQDAPTMVGAIYRITSKST